MIGVFVAVLAEVIEADVAQHVEIQGRRRAVCGSVERNVERGQAVPNATRAAQRHLRASRVEQPDDRGSAFVTDAAHEQDPVGLEQFPDLGEAARIDQHGVPRDQRSDRRAGGSRLTVHDSEFAPDRRPRRQGLAAEVLAAEVLAAEVLAAEIPADAVVAKPPSEYS